MIDVHMFWWSIALILFVVECITPITIFIFPAMFAVVVGILSYYVDSIMIQGVVFFAGSGLSILIVRPFFSGQSIKKNIKSGSEALLGLELKVIETIDNDQNIGKVKHASDTFPARSRNGQIIQTGEKVRIAAIDGITLMVESSKFAFKL